MELGCDRCCCSSQSASERMPAALLCSGSRGRSGRLPHEHAQQRAEALAHVATVDDQVESTVIEQEFAALETFRQRFAHGLLDDARASEADERSRLRHIEV